MSSVKSRNSRAYKIPKLRMPPAGELVPEQLEDDWSSVSEPSSARSYPRTIIVIEPRVLVRDCIVRLIQAAEQLDAFGVATVETALEECRAHDAALFLLSADPMKLAHSKGHIVRLVSETGALVAVLGDGQSRDEIAEILGTGAVGYISTNLSSEVVVGSLRLMLAGGKFAPAEILLASTPSNGLPTPPLSHYNCTFTEQQIAVLAALAEGKANKVIASDLKMEVAAVKTCVRNLLKKLQARNRTQVALIAAHEKRQCQAGKAMFS